MNIRKVNCSFLTTYAFSTTSMCIQHEAQKHHICAFTDGVAVVSHNIFQEASIVGQIATAAKVDLLVDNLILKIVCWNRMGCPQLQGD